MRNLKKILALVLALMMVVSVMVVASAASFNDYDDVDEIDSDYAEAVEVLTNMGVFRGFDGGFQPDTKVTRAEVATLVYRILTADVNDKDVGLYEDYNYFTDVNAANWFAGYVNYAANGKYVVGVGEDRYDPQGNVTGYQLLVIMLRAIGYGKNGEFEGTSQWTINAATTAEQLGITDGLKTNLNKELTREEVAYVLFKAIQVDKVEYTTAFGYQNAFGETTIGYDEFGLEKTAGEITAVNRKDNTTTLGSTEVIKAGTPWTDIGYAAYAYTVPTAGAKTRTAVSDVVITGKSLAVNTAATPDGSFGSIKATATLDSNYHVYYNGVPLNKFYDGQTVPATGYWFDASDMELMNGRERVDIVNGLKVDFVDNDNGGKAEAVVFTEYTVAQVAGIANESNTGTNAYIPNTYYFSTMSLENDKTVDVKADNMVSASTLAVGELVTYVQYAGDTYVTVAPSASGVFTQINYDRVTGNAISYVIGGTTYVKANDEETPIAYVQDYYQGNDSVLTTNDVANKATLIVYTDPYGYMLYVDYAPVTAQYAYVVTNEDTDRIPGTTDTKVVYTDGSVNTLTISSAKVSTGSVMTDFDRNDTDLVDHIYTVAGSNLAYACDGHYSGSVYVNGTSYLEQGAYLTNTSVVVDVRGVLSGTATSATVYTGYGELPTMYNVTMHYVTDARGFVTVAYLTAGQNDASKEFVVYTTGANYFNGATNKYNLPVIMDGQKTTLDLTPGEYAMIGELGVGLYEYNINGTIKTFSGYTSFCEEWYSVDWQDGAIVLEDYFGFGRDYAVSYSNNDVHFWTLDIDKGEAYGYNMLRGDDIHAYVVRDGSKVTDIYVIKGDVTTTGDKSTHYTKPVVVGGEVGYYEYYKQDKFVTRFEFVNTSEDTAAPTAAVVDAEGNVIKAGTLSKDGKTYTIALTYQEYLKADADNDGKVTVKVSAADGNLIGVEGNTPSLSTATYELTLKKPVNKNTSNTFKVNSIGNNSSAVIVQYTIKVTAEEPDHVADLKVADNASATTKAIAKVGDGVFGYTNNEVVQYETLKDTFVASSEKVQSVVWSYTEGGKEYIDDAIPAGSDTAKGSFKVTVTAEDGTEKTYELVKSVAVKGEVDSTVAGTYTYTVTTDPNWYLLGDKAEVKVTLSRTDNFDAPTYNITYTVNNGTAQTATATASGNTMTFTAEVSVTAGADVTIEVTSFGA